MISLYEIAKSDSYSTLPTGRDFLIFSKNLCGSVQAAIFNHDELKARAESGSEQPDLTRLNAMVLAENLSSHNCWHKLKMNPVKVKTINFHKQIVSNLKAANFT